MMAEIYWIYILECSNGSYYTGHTNNISRRYKEHTRGSARFTRSFKPVRIAQLWKLNGTKGNAMTVEAFIKRNNRKYKEELVKNPGKLKKQVLQKLGIDVKLSKTRIPAD